MMPMTRVLFLAGFLLGQIGTALWAQDSAAATNAKVRVTFQVNDAFEKDLVLADVRIGVARAKGGEYVVAGKTDASGKFATELEPGTWYVTYKLANYVGLDYTETVVRDAGATITTTLSMSVEASGLQEGTRRIRIILNWGSRQDQVRDADSHVICACGGEGSHVYYQDKNHASGDHSAALDVDDTDWAGPETITLLEPPAGAYRYWVHDFSGQDATLAASEVVVRVLFGDTVAGEFRVPAHATAREWRPFKEIVVDALLEPTLVPFTQEEIAASADLAVPTIPSSFSLFGSSSPLSSRSMTRAKVTFAIIVVLFIILKLARKKKR